MGTYKVYVKTDSNGYITAVNSSAFLSDLTGWTEIDCGVGDKYHHAQGNYFSKLIMTDGGAYRYKLAEGIPAECTQEEIQRQENTNQTEPAPSQEERINALESQTEMLVQCILEMSEVVYA